MIHRILFEKQDIFEFVMKNMMVSTIPVFGFFYSLKHHELWQWMVIYLPIGVLGYYLVGEKGVIIDSENKRYKIFKNLFFWDLGIWENLPTINRIVLRHLVRFEDTTTKHSWTRTGFDKKYYRVALLNSRENFKLVIMDTSDHEEALDVAESLAYEFNISLEVMKR